MPKSRCKTATIDDLVVLLTARPGLRCSEIGETLWGKTYRNPQTYARPAGRLVARAIREGRVRAGHEHTGNRRRIFFAKD